jgi:hypothetical protein
VRRLALAAALVVALVPASADAGVRLSLGPALALDPAFAAAAAGVDWFLGDRGAVGLAAATTIPGAGDRTAVEAGYAFVSAVGRLRAAAGPRLAAELLAGGGLARIRFGAPGAHTEVAPDAVLGAALALPLPHRLELALEIDMHVTFSAAAAARNPAHTSEVLTVAVRWGP